MFYSRSIKSNFVQFPGRIFKCALRLGKYTYPLSRCVRGLGPCNDYPRQQSLYGIPSVDARRFDSCRQTAGNWFGPAPLLCGVCEIQQSLIGDKWMIQPRKTRGIANMHVQTVCNGNQSYFLFRGYYDRKMSSVLSVEHLKHVPSFKYEIGYLVDLTLRYLLYFIVKCHIIKYICILVYYCLDYLLG